MGPEEEPRKKPCPRDYSLTHRNHIKAPPVRLFSQAALPLPHASVVTLLQRPSLALRCETRSCRAMERSEEEAMEDPNSTSTGGSSGLSPLSKPLKRVDSLDQESNRISGMPRSFSSKVRGWVDGWTHRSIAIALLGVPFFGMLRVF